MIPNERDHIRYFRVYRLKRTAWIALSSHFISARRSAKAPKNRRARSIGRCRVSVWSATRTVVDQPTSAFSRNDPTSCEVGFRSPKEPPAGENCPHHHRPLPTPASQPLNRAPLPDAMPRIVNMRFLPPDLLSPQASRCMYDGAQAGAVFLRTVLSGIRFRREALAPDVYFA